jgi:hypothetical protein
VLLVSQKPFDWWRLAFLIGGGLVLTGGPRHPRGPMAEMLAHPDWTPAHVWMLAGFVALLIGLTTLPHDALLTNRLRRWRRVAIAATAFQAVEVAVHTVAVLDHANLVAGRPTPILTTHMMLSVIAYPLFAVGIIGFMVTASRERTLGSPWITWLGALGALGHGAAAPLAVVAKLAWAPLLFPLLTLLAIWMVLAALWPRGAAAALALD